MPVEFDSTWTYCSRVATSPRGLCYLLYYPQLQLQWGMEKEWEEGR